MTAGSTNRRALIWAAVGAGVIAAYFLAIEPALVARGRLSARADGLAERLELVQRSTGEAERHAQRIALGRRQFGEVAMPGDPRQRPIEFNRRIAETLREAGIAAHESRSRPGSVPRGPLQAALTEGGALESLVTELEFTATPEQVSRVLAALELSPEVAAITRVDLDRAPDGSRSLQVTLALETWIAARGGPR